MKVIISLLKNENEFITLVSNLKSVTCFKSILSSRAGPTLLDIEFQNNVGLEVRTQYHRPTLFQMHFSRTFPGIFKVKIKISKDSNLR